MQAGRLAILVGFLLAMIPGLVVISAWAAER